MASLATARSSFYGRIDLNNPLGLSKRKMKFPWETPRRKSQPKLKKQIAKPKSVAPPMPPSLADLYVPKPPQAAFNIPNDPPPAPRLHNDPAAIYELLDRDAAVRDLYLGFKSALLRAGYDAEAKRWQGVVRKINKRRAHYQRKLADQYPNSSPQNPAGKCPPTAAREEEEKPEATEGSNPIWLIEAEVRALEARARGEPLPKRITCRFKDDEEEDGSEGEGEADDSTSEETCSSMEFAQLYDGEEVSEGEAGASGSEDEEDEEDDRPQAIKCPYPQAAREVEASEEEDEQVEEDDDDEVLEEGRVVEEEAEVEKSFSLWDVVE